MQAQESCRLAVQGAAPGAIPARSMKSARLIPGLNLLPRSIGL